MIYLTVNGLNPDLSEARVNQERPWTHFHSADHPSVGVLLDLCSVPCNRLVNLLPIGQGGLVLKDPLDTRKKKIRLGIKDSPIDLGAVER